MRAVVGELTRPAGPIRAVIAEDHYLVREGTRKLLESSGRVEVIASVSDKAALLEATERLAPEAVVVDIRMPPTHQMEGIEAAHEIRARFLGTGVVVLSQYANALYAFQLFKDGTDGLAYLVKDRVGDLDQLLGAVVAVTEGRSVIDSQVVESLLPRNTISQHPELADLTDREQEVLREMAQGKSNQAIASVLYISESAVEKHVSAIFAKLGLAASDAAGRGCADLPGDVRCLMTSTSTRIAINVFQAEAILPLEARARSSAIGA